MDDKTNPPDALLKRAASFRRLAGEILDGSFRQDLLRMASEYEGQAASACAAQRLAVQRANRALPQVGPALAK